MHGTRQAADAAKKRAVAQHADYEMFKNMVRILGQIPDRPRLRSLRLAARLDAALRCRSPSPTSARCRHPCCAREARAHLPQRQTQRL